MLRNRILVHIFFFLIKKRGGGSYYKRIKIETKIENALNKETKRVCSTSKSMTLCLYKISKADLVFLERAHIKNDLLKKKIIFYVR